MLAMGEEPRYQTGAVFGFAGRAKSPRVVLSSEVCRPTTHLMHHNRNVYACRGFTPLASYMQGRDLPARSADIAVGISLVQFLR